MPALAAQAPEDTRRLEETRKLEQMASRQPRHAIDQAQASLKQARADGDRPAQLKALRLLAMANDQLDDNPALRVAAEEGLALARALGDAQAQCEFIAAQAAVAFNEGRNPESLALYDRAAALAEENRLERDLAKIYVARSHTLNGLERESEALALLLKAYAMFETQDDRLWMSNVLSDVANVYASDTASREELERAVAYHRRAMALIDPTANRFDLATHHHNLGVAYFRLKDYAGARQEFEKCLAIAREMKDEHTVAFVNYRLGAIAAEERKPEEALAYFDKALPVFAENEKVSMQFMASLGRAVALGVLGRRKEAVAALSVAEGLAHRMGSPKRDAQLHEAASGTYARLGEFEKAYQELGALRDAERRVATSARAKMAAELQARFDAKERETENALLRIQQQELEARRLVLVLSLALSLVLAVALALYLMRQLRQNRRFANLAMRDDLTGLPNRRSILEFATAQFKGRRKGDQNLCLALIDLDHFKEVNDEFGHDVGDAVLVAFAQACQRQMRANDRLGRLGGEEFMLVMAGSGASRVPAVFNRLREATRELHAPGFPDVRAMTFSMGATEARADDALVDPVIKRADDALYRAKHNGRDRFEVA